MQEHSEKNKKEKELQELFEGLLLNKTIKSINGSTLELSDGTTLEVFESDSDCCAGAYGEFKWLKNKEDFQGAITSLSVNVSVSEDIYDYFGERKTDLVVRILHNGEGIADLQGTANAGNGGYYFSILSLSVASITKGNDVFELISS